MAGMASVDAIPIKQKNLRIAGGCAAYSEVQSEKRNNRGIYGFCTHNECVLK